MAGVASVGWLGPSPLQLCFVGRDPAPFHSVIETEKFAFILVAIIFSSFVLMCNSNFNYLLLFIVCPLFKWFSYRTFYHNTLINTSIIIFICTIIITIISGSCCCSSNIFIIIILIISFIITIFIIIITFAVYSKYIIIINKVKQ